MATAAMGGSIFMTLLGSLLSIASSSLEASSWRPPYSHRVSNRHRQTACQICSQCPHEREIEIWRRCEFDGLWVECANACSGAFNHRADERGTELRLGEDTDYAARPDASPQFQ